MAAFDPSDILPELPASLTLQSCPLCEGEARLTNDSNCPDCDARPRTRTMRPLLTEVIDPLVGDGRAAKPLLAFAMTGRERNVLASTFHEYVSASLYGTYGKDHHSGVDVRDLGDYDDNSMAGVFGSVLFDYFEEHDTALAEVYRVTVPGGVFFTHIAPYRLNSDAQPPKMHKKIEPRADYFSYLSDDANLYSITVGREWFMQALRDAGFAAKHVTMSDGHSDRQIDWFIGVKPLKAK